MAMNSDVYELIERAKNGDADAKSYLVENNTGLVWSIVKKFYGRGYEADDLYQTGCVGLIKAIQKFDTSFGVQFSTYAVPLILGEIKRFIRDDGIIKVSRNLKQLASKSYGVREMLNKELGREPTITEIAGRVGVPAEEIVMALDACSPPESLHVTSGDDGRELMDKLEAVGSIEDAVINRVSIAETLNQFKVRERQVIILRYFRHKTQSQVAKMLGISQVQICRIEKKVLEEMRNKMCG